MKYDKLKRYATKAVADILPLDKETCNQLVDNALVIKQDQEVREYFLGLLGECDDSIPFIERFIELRKEADNEEAKELKKKSTKSDNSNIWVNESPKVKEKKSKGRLDNNTTSKNTSELLDNKPSNQLSTKQAKKSKKKNLDNLKDIEAALSDLEIVQAKSDKSTTIRICNCMATRHPLFEIAPNCLNCGKIICSKEGLQPCSFCGHDLLSFKDRQDIMNILNDEKHLLINKQLDLKNKKLQEQSGSFTGKQKPNKIVLKMNAGENLWKAQDLAFKKVEAQKKKQQDLEEQSRKEEDEIQQQEEEFRRYGSHKINPDLAQAEERLETLLHFQETGAERTKIIDNASDYLLPNISNSGAIWLSPLERALHLKKQQKQLRKIESTEKDRVGRGDKIVEMVIKNGKVTMVEKTRMHNDDEGDPEDPSIKELEEQLKSNKKIKENEALQNVWDYEADSKKWTKPTYVSSKNNLLDKNTKIDTGRVQFDNNKDETELVLSI